MVSDHIAVEEARTITGVRFTWTGAFWVGLAAIAMLAVYGRGLAWLFDAWSRPEYSHGYLIPPIALYLFFSALRDQPPDLDHRTPRRRLGVATVLFALCIGLLGNVIEAPGVIVYGFVVCVAGLVLTVMGTRRGLRLWAPVFYLVFMLPLPTIIYWQLSLKLQMLSSQIGVLLISWFNIPVLLSGNVIDLGTYKLQVAEACSGLRYLFPLASFGFLFAVLYKGPLWQKVVLFVSALPITVLMNSFRIGVIGLLVDHYGPGQAEGFLHLFEGWIIFIACVALLYVEAIALQRFARHRVPVHKMLEVDLSVLTNQWRRLGSIRPSAALIFVSLAIVVSGLSLYFAPARAVVPPGRDPLVLFPMQLGTWGGSLTVLDPGIEAVLQADDYLDADFAGADGVPPVSLFIAYYQALSQGPGIHSPEVCLPAGGWEVSGWTNVDTGLRTSSGGTLSVNRAIIQQGLSRQLVYYWFKERGRNLTDDYAAKLSTVWDGITRGRMDGALVRVITPIAATGSAQDGDQRLRDFLKLILPKLPQYVPD